MRGDGRRHVGARDLDVLHGVARGDVLEHDFELREALDQRAERLLEECLFAVEDIDRRVGGLAVHQERQPDFLHSFERVEAA